MDNVIVIHSVDDLINSSDPRVTISVKTYSKICWYCHYAKVYPRCRKLRKCWMRKIEKRLQRERSKYFAATT